MKILSRRHSETVLTYSLGFSRVSDPGSGFSFPCDSAGKVETLAPAGAENYAACLTGMVRGSAVVCDGIITHSHRCTTPSKGECECGAHVWLGNFTNTCDACGADYNMSGQLLAPREQWGEETGEHPADCC